MGATCSGGALPDSTSKYMKLCNESEATAKQICESMVVSI